MDNRMKELVAIGASVTARCEPCLKYHAGKAKEYGVEEKEIAETVRVAQIVRKNSTAEMDKFTSKVLEGTAGCGGTADIKCDLS